MQPPKGRVVDHIDANNANNCRFNLRVCAQSENLCNRRKRHGSCSRYIGVLYSEEHHKWYARCRFEGRKHWLGYFGNEIEAARAYDLAAVTYFGEFARLNFPREWPPERRAEVYTQRDAAKARNARTTESRAEPQGRRDRKHATKAKHVLKTTHRKTTRRKRRAPARTRSRNRPTSGRQQ
jgi:hypothetical protein